MDKVPNVTEENIKVIVRIKPNLDNKDKTFFSNYCESNTIIVPDKAQYSFDKVASGDVTQDEIFESCKSLFQSFIDGYNATIFAYGQTGSGKTFTMSGDSDETGFTQNPGLIPRGLGFIFDQVNERALSKSVEYLIKCTFVEIYNEQIYDLLDPQLQRLNLRFNISQEVFLDPCTEIILENPKMADEILKRGLSNRHMASTEMNRESSRSHAVFTIVLESRESQGDIAKIKKSSLHLVDLAGSERQKDAKTDGARLKEACMINKSLLALSMVIRKLVEATKSNKSTYIAYRDSKLTLLLKDAIGGNSKTLLVACVHNNIRFSGEAWSTLVFASSVKMIVNKAKINVDDHGDNESLRKEIKILREMMENYRSPQTIQEHEFDFDLVWKKRFISAMALRSHLSVRLTDMNNNMVIANQTIGELEQLIDTLQMNMEVKDKKLELFENELLNKGVNVGEIKVVIDALTKRLDNNTAILGQQIKFDQMQMEINHLSSELSLAKNRNLMAVADKPLVHSLLVDYNNIIESGEFKNVITKMDNTDAEIINLKEELSVTKLKNAYLKRKVQKKNILHREEIRILKAEIFSIKSNMKAVDQLREDAVADRRKTLLSVHNGRFSPISNARGINCRRRTQKKPEPVIEELDTSEIFVDSDVFFKKNALDLEYLEKANALEEELLKSKMHLGTMEYNVKEYLKEISELKNKLLMKESAQKNFHDLENKYNDMNMALQESNEMVKKLQKENSFLEASKDKTIKLLNEKTYDLEEEIRSIELSKESYRYEMERLEASMISMKQTEDEKDLLEKENYQKDLIIESLNSQISGNISIFKELATVKEELHSTQCKLANAIEISEIQSAENIKLRASFDEYRKDGNDLKKTISLYHEEIVDLQQHNIKLAEDNESLRNNVCELQEEIKIVRLEERQLITELENRFKDCNEDYETKIEKYKSDQIQLSDEISRMNAKLAELEEENSKIKQGPNFSTPKKKLLRSSPSMTSSPLAESFIKDTNSRNSLLDDLIASKNEVDQMLKEKSDIIEKLNVIMGDLFEQLHLHQEDSMVANMETIRVTIINYRADIEELVIRRCQLEDDCRKIHSENEGLKESLEVTKNQRDAFRKDLDEMDLVDIGPNVNHKQKIIMLTRYKEMNRKLRQDNMNQVDENNRLRLELHNAREYY